MPDTPYPKTIVIPDAHKAFVAEFHALLRRYPDASTRYGLADLGDHHVRARIYELECVELGGFTMCDIKERPQ